jgi:hypothetical protein
MQIRDDYGANCDKRKEDSHLRVFAHHLLHQRHQELLVLDLLENMYLY